MARVVVHEAEMDALLHGPNSGMAKELMRRARFVESRAKELCAVDTGRLRASITTVPVMVDGELAVQIGTNVDYAPYLEEGTRRMAARPFLAPALDAAFGF